MEKKMYKIGEVFQCGLIKLKVEETRCLASCCKGCYFHTFCIKAITEEIAGPCDKIHRGDKTDVIFIKVKE